MSDDDQTLDEALARSLRRAADVRSQQVDEAPLDGAAQARVLSALQRESAQLVRARRGRWRYVAAVAIAAGFTLALWPRPPAVSPVPPLACALPSTSLGFDPSSRTLSLGRFGKLIAAPDADAKIVASSACSLVIELSSGTLAAQLQKLRPATLTIRTPGGEVLVRGTTFSVRADDELAVTLLEGAVDVLLSEPDASEPRMQALAAGHVLRRRRTARSADVTVVSEPEQRAVYELLSRQPPTRAIANEAEPAVAPAADELPDATRASKSATELLAEAESARRAGKLELARTRYGQAGAARGADAEVALLRWARLELDADAPAAAHSVLRTYRQRFARGRLVAESCWLELRAYQLLQRPDDAQRAARELVRRYPNSPHAEAARALLAR